LKIIVTVSVLAAQRGARDMAAKRDSLLEQNSDKKSGGEKIGKTHEQVRQRSFAEKGG
jgi:hypothetical protein